MPVWIMSGYHQWIQGRVYYCSTTVAEWRAMFTLFGCRWRMSYACGTLDRKYIVYRRPRHNDSVNFNYKEYILPIGSCGCWLKVSVDRCSVYGHVSDAHISNASELKECLENNSIGFPGADHFRIWWHTPYFIVVTMHLGFTLILTTNYTVYQALRP